MLLFDVLCKLIISPLLSYEKNVFLGECVLVTMACSDCPHHQHSPLYASHRRYHGFIFVLGTKAICASILVPATIAITVKVQAYWAKRKEDKVARDFLNASDGFRRRGARIKAIEELHVAIDKKIYDKD